MKRGRPSLRVLRAMQDVTQARVAERAGLSPTRYWQIENGERHPATRDERAAIATAFGVTPSDIEWPEQLAEQAAS